MLYEPHQTNRYASIVESIRDFIKEDWHLEFVHSPSLILSVIRECFPFSHSMRMSFPLFTLILLSTLRKGKHCADFLAKMNPSTGTWFMEVVNPPLGMHQLILPHVMGLPFIRL
ncbi:hypothetical protein GmHk_05G014573 [Glycine max]|nr:hypothetical protein GmHk_05G014573 [Glycine max]